MKSILTTIALLLAISSFAQEKPARTQWGTLTGQKQFPVGSYIELDDPEKPNSEEWINENGCHVAWGSTDIRYSKHKVPQTILSGKTLKLNGWRGERLCAQLVIWSNASLGTLSYKMPEFKWESHQTKESGFVRYVMTDELNKDKKGACGHRPNITIYDSTLVADVIDHINTKLSHEKCTTQPIWLSIDIPHDVVPGKYYARITILADNREVKTLPIEVNVSNFTLPQPQDYKFHLDLWQNPYAEARYFQCAPWSDKHFALMRPGMELLASAGQKVITTSIMYKPWGGQTQDYFDSMITWIKKIDGTWEFKYDIFDKWVEFMQSVGIDKQINCYSMIPWNLRFKYFDQRTNQMQFIQATPSDKEYIDVWHSLLTSFASHLKAKGWFEKTTIAMDERPKDQMLKVFKIIKEADKDFKVSLAGDWHSELESNLYDYCIAFRHTFPDSIISKRKEQGLVSTYYTCCTEPYPNMFTFSPSAEAEWLGWYAAAKNFDGYLRWAYNSYTLEPLLDSRFRSFAAGDCFLVYPEGRTSIRFERFRQGIQAFEKIQILKDRLQAKGKTEALKTLDEILATFTLKNLESKSAATIVNDAKKKLLEISE